MKFEDFISAQKYAHEKKKETGPKPSTMPLKEKERTPLSPKEVDFFINFQTKTFGKEAADYRKYAWALWYKFFNENPDESPHFKEFENALLRGLHEINTREHVYPEIAENLGQLIQQYGDAVKKVILWSTGDVSATGFQISKIERSGVVKNFYKNLRGEFDKEEVKEFMHEKTGYMVDDDKFLRLIEYVRHLVTETPKGIIKLVILEDTATNFDKVRAVLEESLGREVMKRIKIAPIWAAYSRYGQRGLAMAQAKSKEVEFEQKKKTLNAIDSFSDLNSRKKFGKIFRGAHVFVDFDGVILNDDTRRIEQTEIVFRALSDAAEKRGMSREDIRREIREPAK